MSLRFPVSLLALGVVAASASAQTADHPSIVPSLPATPLFVPNMPMPLDGATAGSVELQTSRTYSLKLRNVKPSVMAYWLDPKFHQAPLELQNEAIAKLPHYHEGDALDIPSPFLRPYQLPAGVDRVVPVDPQNALLVFGMPQGVAQLSQIIQLLDRPAPVLKAGEVVTLIQSHPGVEFNLSIFWIDSLAPLAKSLGQTASSARVAKQPELDSLEQLKAQDRALLQILPPQTAASDSPVVVAFAPATANSFPLVPNYKSGGSFRSTMPRIQGNPDIDPGIRMPNSPLTVQLKGGELRLTPMLDEKGALSVQIQSAAILSQLVPLRDGESLIWSGFAKNLGLQAPSPRFDAFVVRITPNIHAAFANLLPAP